jgi:Predicted membrane protein (DUF2306)
MDVASVPPRSQGVRLPRWPSAMLLSVAMLIALGFVVFFALRYFLAINEQAFGFYWPRRGWLLFHVGAGMVALLTGPGQLWLGLNRKRLALHRTLGTVYMAAIAVSSVAAF